LQELEGAGRRGGEEEWLAAVKKEAFAEDDESVLMIDPGMDTNTIFGDVKLPCEQVPRINNSTKSRIIPVHELTAQEKRPQTATVTTKTLHHAEKAFKYPQPVEKPQKKGYVPQEPKSEAELEYERLERQPAQKVNEELLNFDNIAQQMGMDSFIDSLLEGEDLSDGDDDYDQEEERKELEAMRKKAKR